VGRGTSGGGSHHAGGLERIQHFYAGDILKDGR
jgi:hypothetical protein